MINVFHMENIRLKRRKNIFVKFLLLNRLCLDLGPCTCVTLDIIHHITLSVNTAGLKVGFLQSSGENISPLIWTKYMEFSSMSLCVWGYVLHWCWNNVCSMSTTGRVEFIYIYIYGVLYCRHISCTTGITRFKNPTLRVLWMFMNTKVCYVF